MNDKEITLQNKQKEERKKLILKLLSSERFEIIKEIEALRIPHTKLGLTLNEPLHRQWLEEFTVIFDDNGDDELIEISVDQVEIIINEKGEAIIQYDFDDILENEIFNIGHLIPLEKAVDENGFFDITLFQEQLRIGVQDAIQSMIELKQPESNISQP